MKRLLFATTALIATAGLATAEVTFSGLARFGVSHLEDRGRDTLDTGATGAAGVRANNIVGVIGSRLQITGLRTEADLRDLETYIRSSDVAQRLQLGVSQGDLSRLARTQAQNARRSAANPNLSATQRNNLLINAGAYDALADVVLDDRFLLALANLRSHELREIPNATTDIDLSISQPGAGSDVSDTILAHRFRMNIDASTETNGGVELWARVRLQADENASTGEANAASLNGARFRIAYGGLSVEVGNVAGAIDNLSNYYGNEPGLENFIGQYKGVNYDFLGYSSTTAGSNALFFQYAVGDFVFKASYDQNASVRVSDRFARNDYVITASRAYNGVDRWDLSAEYSFGDVTAALGYAENDLNESLTVLTLGADFGDLSGSLFIADDDVTGETLNGTAYGLSAAYNIGSTTTLTFAYGDGSADGDTQEFGVGAIYDLGGGASLRGGIGQTKIGDGDGRFRADFGAQFNF